MLCTHCNKKEATIHCKTVKNGIANEMHLCSDCAQEMGIGGKYADLFGDGFDFNSILNQVFSMTDKKISGSGQLKCESCGTDFGKFNSTGLLGCDKCYDVFADAVETMLQKTQGATVHNGKISGPDSEKMQKENQVRDLKSQLQKAILEEKYEEAADLRDRIKAIEKGDDNNV